MMENLLLSPFIAIILALAAYKVMTLSAQHAIVSVVPDGRGRAVAAPHPR